MITLTSILIKVTLLLLLGSALARAMRSRSAAARHFVWSATLFGCVAVAGLALVTPPLKVAIPTTAPIPAFDRAPVEREAPALRAPGTSLPSARPAEARRSAAPFVWAIGFAGVLGWIALGHLALARIARRAKPAYETDGVPVRISTDVSAPVTWNWRKPMILLPVEAEAWPDDRRHAALQHELAHVSRFDSLTQLLAALVCALYWFHPLVWFAMRRLRAESEHACDDRVLARGMTAPEYATHLLAVAHGALSRRHGALAAVAMARPSQLESRLVAVLDETRSRASISRRVAFIAAIIVAAVLLPLAAARPELRAATRRPLRAAVAPLQAMSDAVSAVTSIKTKEKEDDEGPRPRIDHSIEAAPGETLYLDLKTGASVIVSGWDEPRVFVEAKMRGRDIEDTLVSVARAEGGVRINTSYEGRSSSHSTSIGFKIRVPRRFNIELDSAGGGLTLLDLHGTFQGTTGGGEITIDRVTGTANITTGGGEIDVRDSELDGRVSTGGGPVTLTRVRGGLHGASGSGPVTTSKDNTYTMSLSGGDIDIGRMNEDVDASTGGGDVTIGPVAGSVSASTGGGDVEITVVDANGKTQNVDVSTGSGRVILELPASLDARFELESSYTESFGRKTRIESDWDLQQTEDLRWDGREGTPRRYVRARGTAGAGRGLVRVKAINGDVVVRRR